MLKLFFSLLGPRQSLQFEFLVLNQKLEFSEVDKPVSVDVRLSDHGPDLGPGQGLSQAGHGAVELGLGYKTVTVLIKHPVLFCKLDIIFQRSQVAF